MVACSGLWLATRPALATVRRPDEHAARRAPSAPRLRGRSSARDSLRIDDGNKLARRVDDIAPEEHRREAEPTIEDDDSLALATGAAARAAGAHAKTDTGRDVEEARPKSDAILIELVDELASLAADLWATGRLDDFPLAEEPEERD
jgi:hypothetical protein